MEITGAAVACQCRQRVSVLSVRLEDKRRGALVTSPSVTFGLVRLYDETKVEESVGLVSVRGDIDTTALHRGRECCTRTPLQTYYYWEYIICVTGRLQQRQRPADAGTLTKDRL